MAVHIRHTIRLAVRSLAAHRLRSALTTLGIVLGVGSVIVMLGVGEAARYNALKQLQDLGADTIILRSTKPPDDGSPAKGADLLAFGLTYTDFDRIRSTIPTVIAATPTREYRKKVRVLDRKLDGRIVGVTPEFFRQNNFVVVSGRAILAEDERHLDNVAVLGASAAEILFPAEDPIGKSISIEDLFETKAFRVVGVIAPKTLAAGAESTGDQADFTRVVMIPFATDRARFGKELISRRPGAFSVEKLEISQITVTVDDVKNVPKTAVALQSLIDQQHPQRDVLLFVPLELLRRAEATQRMFTLILGAIAGISLVVGGIGIMNIMLATVTERTREIGIRRALGAKRRDIAVQFLIETVALSCGGGVIGVGLGIGLAYTLDRTFGVPTLVKAWSPAVAFGVSVVVGLLSGGYPARRAARLDPIEALRHAN